MTTLSTSRDSPKSSTDMEGWKRETVAAYDLYPELFDERFGKHFHERVINDAEAFLINLRGRAILDLGSGPGIHAEFFMSRGFEVMCIDLSPAMVERCRRRGLRAEIADMESLDYRPDSFDGIWAYASLLHLPKERIPAMIAKLRGWLKPQGILAMAFKQGDGEGLEPHERFPHTQRWFTYVTMQEAMNWCEGGFKPIRSTTHKVSERSTFINLMFVRT
jgi:SAM-dependent methyltransferase